MGVEICGNGVAFQADRYDYFGRNDNAQRHRIIILIAAQKRNVDDDQELILIQFSTGFFFFIQRRGQIFFINMCRLGNFVQFFFSWRNYVDPTSFF